MRPYCTSLCQWTDQLNYNIFFKAILKNFEEETRVTPFGHLLKSSGSHRVRFLSFFLEKGGFHESWPRKFVKSSFLIRSHARKSSAAFREEERPMGQEPLSNTYRFRRISFRFYRNG